VVSGRKVVMHTDAKSWGGLNLKQPRGVVARLLLDILDICPTVITLPGVENVVADALSSLHIAYPVTIDDKRTDIPPHLRYSCFYDIHRGLNGGHFGLSSTLKQMRKRYFWNGMDNDDVKLWYESCVHCEFHKHKQNTHLKAPMTGIVANAPWEIVGVDVINMIMPNGEKKNALVMIDNFSKELRVAPLNHATADKVVENFQIEVEWLEGCPKTIISDSGSNLLSNSFKTYVVTMLLSGLYRRILQ